MNIYNQYCYPDMPSLLNDVVSAPIQVSGSNIIFSSLVSVSGNTATFSTTLGNYTRAFAECAAVGPVVTNTMMTVSDALELSGAVITVWALAYAVKVLRRAL